MKCEIDKNVDRIITKNPNAIHATQNMCCLVHDCLDKCKKHMQGKIKASIVAANPPVSSLNKFKIQDKS